MVSSGSVGWGLVGASSWAAEFMIDALRSAGDGRVVSVFSASAERGQRFAAAHGIPRADATLDGLLDDPEVDAIYVSTTNDLHAEQVVAGAQAGKHVLCEKPLAIDLQDALRMRDACREAGVVMGVNHHMRCQDTVREMRRLLQSGAIGDVLAARSAHTGSLVAERRTWRTNRPEAGAGVVLDLTVHDVDTLRYLLDDEIGTVAVMTATQGVAEAPIEDSVMGTMRTQRGTLVSFHDAFTIAHAGTALEVHGTTGSLIGRDLFGPTPSGDVFIRRHDDLEPVAIGERRNPYVRGVEAFVAAMHGRGRPAATAEDGIMSLAVALAVLAAAANGRTVAVDGNGDLEEIGQSTRLLPES